MWKPGQIVTINGVVYRVKRNHDSRGPCEKCALNVQNIYPTLTWRSAFCTWNNSKKYSLPGYCYLVRLSPVIVAKHSMWKPGQLITTPRGAVYRVKKGTCAECNIWQCSPFCTICKCELFACLKRVSPIIPIVKWGFNGPSPRGQF